MITRRLFAQGLAGVFASMTAPAVVSSKSLMKVRDSKVWVPPPRFLDKNPTSAFLLSSGTSGSVLVSLGDGSVRWRTLYEHNAHMLMSGNTKVFYPGD